MGFLANRLQFRILRNARDYSFIDKIGSLTNAFISFLPNTELRRSGEYSALIITNNVYNFESQITPTEINLTMKLNQHFPSDDFSSTLDSIYDLSEKLIGTIKSNLGLPTDLKSSICLFDGIFDEYDDAKYIDILNGAFNNNIFEIKTEEAKQLVYIWRVDLKEYFISISNEDGVKRLIYAIQDFGVSSISFLNIRTLIDLCLKEFENNLLVKFNEE